MISVPSSCSRAAAPVHAASRIQASREISPRGSGPGALGRRRITERPTIAAAVASFRGSHTSSAHRRLIPADRRLRADRRLPLRGARLPRRVDRLVLPAAIRLGERVRPPARPRARRPLLARADRRRAVGVRALLPRRHARRRDQGGRRRRAKRDCSTAFWSATMRSAPTSARFSEWSRACAARSSSRSGSRRGSTTARSGPGSAVTATGSTARSAATMRCSCSASRSCPRIPSTSSSDGSTSVPETACGCC